jgi:hypothetical protein
MMMIDDAVAAAKRIRMQMETIEREATDGRVGFPDFIAKLPEAGRERVISLFLDPSTVERWRALRLALADIEATTPILS